MKLLLVLSLILSAFAVRAGDFKTPKKLETIWPSIPFYEGGDLGQYERTMAKDRDTVRKEFFGELMDALEKMADRGAVVEVMLEPMANILMAFDQMHDIHKMKDVVNVSFSLENQFKASLDNLFLQNDVRDNDRKIQISAGTNSDLLQAYIRGISKDNVIGKPITQNELNIKYSLEIYEQVDYISYGTFSSLGNGNFQVTYHIQGYKNGVTRNFIARGELTSAINNLAKQVFDYFQKTVFPDWEAPQKALEWLPMPIVASQENDEEAGYTFTEANLYCKARGYRLPYARELMLAQTGGVYKVGGIASLDLRSSYAVADRRFFNANHFLTLAHSNQTFGPIEEDTNPPRKGKFWCVRGNASEDVLIFEKLWSLRREYREKNKNIFVAIETIRFELGDFDTDSIYWERNLQERLSGLDEALKVLAMNGIVLDIPASLKR